MFSLIFLFYSFGSKYRSTRTGIMYNDLIDDFSTPRQKNAFGIEPSQSNIIQPGKCLSSINPMSRRRMFSYIEFPRSQGHAHNIRSGALVTRMATYRRARTFRHALTECLSKREKVQYLQTWRWSVVPNESSRDFGPCDRFWTQLALRCFLLPTSPPSTALRERYVGP